MIVELVCGCKVNITNVSELVHECVKHGGSLDDVEMSTKYRLCGFCGRAMEDDSWESCPWCSRELEE